MSNTNLTDEELRELLVERYRRYRSDGGEGTWSEFLGLWTAGYASQGPIAPRQSGLEGPRVGGANEPLPGDLNAKSDAEPATLGRSVEDVQGLWALGRSVEDVQGLWAKEQREAFAQAALTGLLANHQTYTGSMSFNAQDIAMAAWHIATAMQAQRPE